MRRLVIYVCFAAESGHSEGGRYPYGPITAVLILTGQAWTIFFVAE
jgi:hypothetical protein